MKIDREKGFAIIVDESGYRLAKFTNGWRTEFEVVDSSGQTTTEFSCESYDDMHDFYSMPNDGHDYNVVHVVRTADHIHQLGDLSELTKIHPLPDFSTLRETSKFALANSSERLAKGEIDHEDFQFDYCLVTNFACFYREYLVTGSLQEAQAKIVRETVSDDVRAVTRKEATNSPAHVAAAVIKPEGSKVFRKLLGYLSLPQPR